MTDVRTPADLFGRNVVAMVTPMEADGSVSEPGVLALVDHLLSTGVDGLVVAGTTGEAPTLSDEETARLIRTVVDRAAGRVRVIAGVGTYDTAHTVHRARAAEAAGADALLLVTPYYSKPTQAGVVAHCRVVADATHLPVMLYDIPGRSGLALTAATLTELAGHPNIRAVKDAKGDLFEALTLMSSTPLAYYCGIDELNLPYLAAGATGLVSVVGNVAAERNRRLIAAVDAGDLAAAREINAGLIAVTDALMRTSGGAVMAKTALAHLGVIPTPAVRLPLVEPETAHREQVTAALDGLDVDLRVGELSAR
ncbi:4-hydroxy-tetrahydrodipicolinate synthase [Spongisporangium articulatum]|uniref:4-hydroxy-tetrahydrodipicolinate synthase n=1 Tax=Spongisporangium articulatum TaxID=3362603 RepID=A0ABW8AT75_9ACTN